MKLSAIKCPNCGSSLEIEDGIDTFFCKYCGEKIMMEDMSASAYKAKTKLKKMEHDERMADKKYAHEKEMEKMNSLHTLLPVFIFFAVTILIWAIALGSAKHASNKEIKELDKLIVEIQGDIKNGDYDTAYIKAQSVKTTSDWSHEIDEKYDNIRKELINQIIAAEIKETGSSSHEPEKEKGLFEKLME